MFDPLVISAMVTALGAVVVALISVWSKFQADRRKEQAELEMAFTKAALDFGQFVEEWGETHDELRKLLEETSVDRFLILRAWNGRFNPRWTTAVFQMRQGKQLPVSYVHIELDADYVSRLHEISARLTSYWLVDQMPDSEIKRIYQNEGVTAAMWALLDRRKGPQNSQAVTYCSFATHDPGGISENDLTRCRILVGRIKGLANNFGGYAMEESK